jgi:hypothetical protein
MVEFMTKYPHRLSITSEARLAMKVTRGIIVAKAFKMISQIL